MSIEGLENVRDIFSIFHDGVVSSCAVKGDDLTLAIEIQYLAQRVQPEFRTFQVHLVGVGNIRFSAKSAPVVLTDIGQIELLGSFMDQIIRVWGRDAPTRQALDRFLMMFGKQVAPPYRKKGTIC